MTSTAVLPVVVTVPLAIVSVPVFSVARRPRWFASGLTVSAPNVTFPALEARFTPVPPEEVAEVVPRLIVPPATDVWTSMPIPAGFVTVVVPEVNVPPIPPRLSPLPVLFEEVRLVKVIPEALAATPVRSTAAAFVADTVTPFWTVMPVIAPAWLSVKPTAPVVAMSRELTRTELPPSVTVPVSVGLPAAPIERPEPASENAAPWPQRTWLASSVMAPVVVAAPVCTNTTSPAPDATSAFARLLKGELEVPIPLAPELLTYQTCPTSVMVTFAAAWDSTPLDVTLYVNVAEVSAPALGV